MKPNLTAAELKACPFCGHAEQSIKQTGINRLSIQCPNCSIERNQKWLRYGRDWLQERMTEHWNTRPPVAGLAELTDAQLVELFDYIEVARGNAAQKHWASSETMQSWEARRKVVIAKAAREFLGKVDG